MKEPNTVAENGVIHSAGRWFKSNREHHPGSPGIYDTLLSMTARKDEKTCVGVGNPHGHTWKIIGVFHFAVYIAIDAEDTESRFDALAVLNDLGLWLTRKDETGNFENLPELGEERKAVKFTISSTPSIAARLENGTEEYQVLLALEYKYTPRR